MKSSLISNDVILLSKYIVTKCVKDDCPITNLQLQKILYCIQRYFLKHNSAAFYDEFEAWHFGPCIPNVYYHFCGFGAMPITNTYNTSLLDFNKETKRVIDDFIEKKRTLAPWDFYDEIMGEGSAWKKAYEPQVGFLKSFKAISFESIRAEAT